MNKTQKNTKIKKFTAGAQLGAEERNMLDIMLSYEKQKVKKILGKEVADKAVNDSTFIRNLIKQEYKKRSKQISKIKS